MPCEFLRSNCTACAQFYDTVSAEGQNVLLMVWIQAEMERPYDELLAFELRDPTRFHQELKRSGGINLRRAIVQNDVRWAMLVEANALLDLPDINVVGQDLVWHNASRANSSLLLRFVSDMAPKSSSGRGFHISATCFPRAPQTRIRDEEPHSTQESVCTSSRNATWTCAGSLLSCNIPALQCSCGHTETKCTAGVDERRVPTCAMECTSPTQNCMADHACNTTTLLAHARSPRDISTCLKSCPAYALIVRGVLIPTRSYFNARLLAISSRVELYGVVVGKVHSNTSQSPPPPPLKRTKT